MNAAPIMNYLPPVDARRGATHPVHGTPAREAAVKFVSSALVAPALEALHESPLRPKSGPFAESVVERRFGPILQQELADRITTSASFTLVDTIVRHLDRRAEGTRA